MNIIVNGEARQLPDPTTAAALIQLLGLEGKRIAMEVNREIVPRSEQAICPLQEGDVVEIVFAVGGG